MRGANLDPSPDEVRFGSATVDVTDPLQFKWLNPEEVEVMVPVSVGPGEVAVSYKNPGATPYILASPYEYTCGTECAQLGSVAPASGPLSGGNTVCIAGQDFCQGVEVYFGHQLATVQSINPNRACLIAPGAAGVGVVDLTVIRASGRVCTLSGVYTYQ